MKIQLTVPWPPSLNHYKKVGAIVRTKKGKIFQKRVDTNSTKQFYWDVYQECKKRIPAEWDDFRRSETISFKVYVYLYPPDNRRRDVDNSLKVLLDSLVRAQVIYDDSQITRLCVQKMNIIESGQVIVRIQPIGEIRHEPFP